VLKKFLEVLFPPRKKDLSLKEQAVCNLTTDIELQSARITKKLNKYGKEEDPFAALIEDLRKVNQ